MAESLQLLLDCGLPLRTAGKPFHLSRRALTLACQPTTLDHRQQPEKAKLNAGTKTSQQPEKAKLNAGTKTDVPKPIQAGAKTNVLKLCGAGEPLPDDAEGFACMSWNVLLPNSEDGWWIYKYYRNPAEEHTCWAARQQLMSQRLLSANADILCLQELSELSFENDFRFLLDAGYESVLHQKGRMRPATFWRAAKWEKVNVLQKDRSLILCIRKKGGSNAGTILFVVNVHLSAGPEADRRLRQMHEALETVAKEAKKMSLDVSGLPVVVCGDFNSQGQSAVRELLVAGSVGPEFREAGDPTEKGQEGKQITSKTKSHKLCKFLDATDLAFYEKGGAPSTLLVANIDAKMLEANGEPTKKMEELLRKAFESCCSEGSTEGGMLSADIERFLLRINRKIGRGSEFRFVEACCERRGERILSYEDFRALYVEELKEGKFWGVEHDLRELLGFGLEEPASGPCQLRFDYIYFTTGTLQLRAAQEPLRAEEYTQIFGAPYEVLPNPWHPSDHLPVSAFFTFG